MRSHQVSSHQEANQLVNNIRTVDLDFVSRVKEKIIEEWQDIWNNTNTLLRRLEPTVKQKYESKNLNRLDTIKSFRLRTGHTNLTHKHLLKGEMAPTCEICDELLTVQHFITVCPAYDIQRQLFGLSASITENLKKENLKNTLEYLKSIGLYDKI